MAIELNMAVITGLANMCEAANEAYPIETFVASARDLLPVAEFIQSLQREIAMQEEASVTQP